MQTATLVNLLECIIETNRVAEYYAGFRYAVDADGKENLAIDLFKDNTSYYHKVVSTNTELYSAYIEFNEATKSKTKWHLYYCDEDFTVDVYCISEALSVAKAFLLKQKYNIDVTITEVLDEDL